VSSKQKHKAESTGRSTKQKQMDHLIDVVGVDTNGNRANGPLRFTAYGLLLTAY